MSVILTFKDGHHEVVSVDVRVNFDKFIIYAIKNCGVTSYELI